VAKHRLAPEPVATDALVHLLRRSEALRHAVSILAADLCPDLRFAPLSYSGQVTADADTGRPDVVGSDTDGSRVIIEAKFDAALTERQLDDTYLNRLPPGQPGLLVYIAPSNRLPSLWPQLLAGPAGQGLDLPPNLADADQPWLVQRIGDGRVVAAVAWTTLLGRLSAALVDAGDTASQADLDQLADLVRWRAAEQWVPYVPGDLPDRTARQIQGLRNALVKAAASVSGSKPTRGTSDHGPGRWLSTPEGRKIWAGIWYEPWGRHGSSPAWVWVLPKAPHTTESVYEALATLGGSGGPGVFSVGKRWAIPLAVDVGTELGAVTSSFAEQITEVADLLDAAAVDTDQTEDDWNHEDAWSDEDLPGFQGWTDQGTPIQDI